MNYRDDDNNKIPFYMTYPMQNIFLEEAEYERDMERLKNMYPQDVRNVQRMVEEECDKMEYEGSMMFDESPDRLMLRQICDRIYQRLMEEEEVNLMQGTDFEEEQYEPVEAEELRMIGQRGQGRPPARSEPWAGPLFQSRSRSAAGRRQEWADGRARKCRA